MMCSGTAYLSGHEADLAVLISIILTSIRKFV